MFTCTLCLLKSLQRDCFIKLIISHFKALVDFMEIQIELCFRFKMAGRSLKVIYSQRRFTKFVVSMVVYGPNTIHREITLSYIC